MSLCLPILVLGLTQLQTSITLPINTAYVAGRIAGATINDDGVLERWSNPGTKIEWGGYFSKSGIVHAVASVDLREGDLASYSLSSAGEIVRAGSSRTGTQRTVDFGFMKISRPGWRTFFLSGIHSNGKSFGNLLSLRLEGDAVEGAKFNLKPRRNSASVHLSYPIAPSDQVEWFYNEVTAQEDPLDTYYMACGFRRGYFGMQVNGPGERRIIFSVWDSGIEAVDRAKVQAKDKVQLLAKGPGVFADGFGNEGTGGHSHLVYAWKTHVTQKFLLHAQPSADHTIYTAYFYKPESKRWDLIAKFSAPRDGTYLQGLYSFVEDFNGDNGNLKRKAHYGPAWVRTQQGQWKPLLAAKFSHDATGGVHRFDYDFGVEKDRFFLQNGGFEGRTPKYGAKVSVPEVGQLPPDIVLSNLK